MFTAQWAAVETHTLSVRLSAGSTEESSCAVMARSRLLGRQGMKSGANGTAPNTNAPWVDGCTRLEFGAAVAIIAADHDAI